MTMTRFFSVAVASLLLLLVDQSSSSSLRSFSEQDQNRRLSYELIANYEPKSQVTDHVSELPTQTFWIDRTDGF